MGFGICRQDFRQRLNARDRLFDVEEDKIGEPIFPRYDESQEVA